MNEKPSASEDVGASRGWYSRGYLPHFDGQHLIQFITYRLADSLPQSKLKELKEELKKFPKAEREIKHQKRIEDWLDAGMGCCALAHPDVARVVQNSFLHFHGERYHLHAWCVMPNHVHVLIEPLIDIALIVQGWKSYTSRWVLGKNKELDLGIPTTDQFWMREYWDRYIRDDGHYQRAVEYIHQNPVKAGLCSQSTEWPWSSAFGGNR
jgi:putative transposase